MAGQDISFESMAKHLKAVSEIVRGSQCGQVGTFVMGGNQGGFFAQMKPRADRRLICRSDYRRAAAQAGCGSGRHGLPAESSADHRERPVLHQRLSDDHAEHQPQGDLRLGRAAYAEDADPARVSRRESDLQIRSPQVVVDIDRDRAIALGLSPQQIEDALYTAYGDRQVSTIYTPADQYAVIMQVAPEYQRTPEGLSKIYSAFRARRAHAARFGG